MRISQHYNLNRTQPSLDFVDVDIFGDTLLFVDPRAIRLLQSRWGDECVSLIQDFFRIILECIRTGNNTRAQSLLSYLREPNETHLGYSRDRARGRGVGDETAIKIWEALRRSEAIHTGILEDLEDSILMIEGIDSDIVSDIATNIIRQPLIEYTNDACRYYGIPMVNQVDSGSLWDPSTESWYSRYVELPIANSSKLLLVPKVIVRRTMNYDQDEYYRHYILEELRLAELNANTELVHLLKDGTPRVTKKDLKAKYGSGKSVIVRETLNHPNALIRYRQDKSKSISPPLDHHQLAEISGTQTPDWPQLISDVISIPAGRDTSNQYEYAIEKLLTVLFYPPLTNPQPQLRIHQGRKRIDITYSNVASSGFFYWLALNYPAAHIFVECKNYTGEVANPELDQLAGRFSPSRGQVGLILCRNLDDKELFIQRCIDTAHDSRGYIIPIDDTDLNELIRQRQDINRSLEFYLLAERFRQLIL